VNYEAEEAATCINLADYILELLVMEGIQSLDKIEHNRILY